MGQQAKSVPAKSVSPDAVRDAIAALRMVERAWASGTPSYVNPDSPLAKVQRAIAGLSGASA